MMRLIPTLIVPTLLALFPLSAASHGAAAATPIALANTSQGDDLPDLKDVVDGSVRWIRSTQNPENGSYGGGVEATSWVLYSLRESPRAYVAADGPFIKKALEYLLSRQAEDGSIADPKAEGAARVAQTRVAAAALSVHAGATTAPALGRAAIWLAKNGVSAPTMDAIDIPGTAQEQTKLAMRLVSSLGENGSTDGIRGAVIETSRSAYALSMLRKKLTPEASGERPQIAPLPKFTPATQAEIDAAVLKGARFLLVASEDGKWGGPGRPDAGLTAMVISALQVVPEPRPGDIQGTIDSGLEWIAAMAKEDGSIHQGRLKNYVTSAAIMALSKDKKYAPQVANAAKFIERLQADEGEGYSEGDLYYGGIGYGGDERPDLSNLQMALEALRAAGAKEDDPAIQNALKFLERCQNRSESNDVEVTRKGIVIKSGDDGGSGYMPGDSKAGFITLADGTQVPRSYGSMTYALLKGFSIAGLKKDDPRVEACWKWLTENYTLDVNPGFVHSNDPLAPYQGLFYYFTTMAKALDIYGAEAIVTKDNVSHDWRAELAGRLVSMQSKADGSWVNRNAPRWWEGNPVLATAYALQALGATRKDVK